MAKGAARDSQIASLIGEELDYILASASDPRISALSVTRVEPTPGGAHFTVYLAPSSPDDDSDESYHFDSIVGANFYSVRLKETLKHASGYLRSELAQALNLKRMPELHFVPDPLL